MGKELNGKDVVDFIKEHNLEDAIVTVSATRYYDGDHDCKTTGEVRMSKSSMYLGRGKSVPTIDFYVDSNLY